LDLFIQGDNVFHPFGCLIFKIWKLKDKDCNITLQHTYREGIFLCRLASNFGATSMSFLHLRDSCHADLRFTALLNADVLSNGELRG